MPEINIRIHNINGRLFQFPISGRERAGKRDDRVYWMRMEKYIEERSAAEFTHSLCPECEELLYGGEKGRR